MKHYILVYLEKPSEEDRQLSIAWESLLSTLEQQQLLNKEKGMIGVATWLIPRSNEASTLAQIVYAAGRAHISHVVHFLSADE